jgi:tetratricopeptide (TPR) repeat protein
MSLIPDCRLLIPARAGILISAALAVVSLAVFAPACTNQFINYDDGTYVTRNPNVQDGLTPAGVRWALTSTRMANWHPLTWLSFQLDAQVFARGPQGLAPWGFHLTNIVLHAACTVLLFGALWRMTEAIWPSALVAALFAVHPLHVESVAWVAERKDVLSTLFWMLTLWAYAGYVRRPALFRYLAVLVAFALGLTAKPMLVTLPCVLLLLDYWPLRRFAGSVSLAGQGKARTPGWLLMEKLPLFALAAMSSAVTLRIQEQVGTVNTLGQLPARAENALVSYVRYLGKAFWPNALVPFYPYHVELSHLWWAAALLLTVITILAIVLRQRCPYLIVGWLWYLGTLVPVIGLVQVLGGHAMADRYTYVPIIGIFLAVSWGLADWSAHPRAPRWLPVAAAAAVLMSCAAVTAQQIGYWRDSLTLWRHTVESGEDCPLAQCNLGTALGDLGHSDDASRYFHWALEMDPDYVEAHYCLGRLAASMGNRDEAVRRYRQVLEIDPDHEKARNSLGIALAQQGKFGDAIAQFRHVLARNAENADAHYNLGRTFHDQGRLSEAAGEYAAALRIYPRYLAAHYGLAVVFALQRRLDDAVRHYNRVLEIEPTHAPAHDELGFVLLLERQLPAAISHLREALRLRPDMAQAHLHLGMALTSAGNKEEAAAHYQEAKRLSGVRDQGPGDQGSQNRRQ